MKFENNIIINKTNIAKENNTAERRRRELEPGTDIESGKSQPRWTACYGQWRSLS